MAEKQNTPEIRFEGFTDPWEQRKLGEVASEFQSGEFISATEITENGDYPVYGGNGLRGYANRYNHEGFYALIGRQGALCGNVNCADGKAYFTEHAVAVQANQCNDTGFLVYLLSRMNLGQYSGQSAQPGLAVSTLKEVETLLPSKYEQYRIGSLLKDLDSLITLHQRKYDKLCTVKKSMLDKMFPKPGETEPEIRFEGFTDPWEQRKFSDMYVVNNERNTNCELGYDRTLSIATMTFNGGNGAADDSLSNYKVIRIGDIAFEGHTNKVHAYGRFVLNDAGDGLMSPRFSCLRPIVEQRYSFWKYYIPREESMRPILVNATKSGTMMNELVPDDLMRESILVPCLAEQEVIGNSLSQLDHLITLHQREPRFADTG